MADLGDKIRAARGSLTQKELAEKLDVDKTTIASWEIGRREPDIDSLIKIADLSGVSLDWLTSRHSYSLDMAKAYNASYWRDCISFAIENNINPQQLMSLLETIASIKDSTD